MTPTKENDHSDKNKAQKQKPPIDSRLLDFTFPKLKKRQLRNGLTIFIIERHDLPKVYLRLGMNFGIKNDGIGKAGLNQLMVELIKKGTRQKSYNEIIDAIEAVGGELGALVNEDSFIIFSEFLREHMDFGLNLMSEIALDPAFPEGELEKERSKLLANLENEKSSPEFLAHRRLEKALFLPHPYGQHKTLQSIENIARQDLSDFRRKYFVPARAFLIVAGDVSESAAVESAEKHLGGWSGQASEDNHFEQPQPAEERIVHLIDRPGSEQVNLVLGNLLFSRNHSEYEKALVMNKILGGGGSGRLFMNLREEKGYTYGAYSTLQTYKSAGAFIANAEVRPEVTGKALQAFFEEFDRIKQNPVTEDELHNSKRYLMGIFPLQNETPSSVAALYLKQRLYDLPDDYWDRYLDRIDAVGLAEVQNAAQKYIREDEMPIIVVGDAGKLKDQLKEFGEIYIFDTEDERIG